MCIVLNPSVAFVGMLLAKCWLLCRMHARLSVRRKQRCTAAGKPSTTLRLLVTVLASATMQAS